MDTQTTIDKAVKLLAPIATEKGLDKTIMLLENSLVEVLNKSDIDAVKEEKDVNEVIRERLSVVDNRNKSYKKRRKNLTKALEAVDSIEFTYEKKDGSTRQAMTVYTTDYTYDKPKKDDEFIFMLDSEDGVIKHFKLDKMSNITYNL